MRPFLALCKFCESKSTLHHLGSQNKKFSFKSYSIFRDGIALFMNPVLGKVEEKGGYLNTNQGSMRIDLVPFEMEGGKVKCRRNLGKISHHQSLAISCLREQYQQHHRTD